MFRLAGERHCGTLIVTKWKMIFLQEWTWSWHNWLNLFYSNVNANTYITSYIKRFLPLTIVLRIVLLHFPASKEVLTKLALPMNIWSTCKINCSSSLRFRFLFVASFAPWRSWYTPTININKPILLSCKLWSMLSSPVLLCRLVLGPSSWSILSII